MKLSDAGESILENLKERFSSPLAGGFLIAWFIYNWDTVYFVLTTKRPPDEVIHIVHENFATWSEMLWLPLIYAFAFAFIFPILSLAATALWELVTPLRKMHTAWLAGAALVEKGELQAVIASYEAELQNKEDEISQLKSNLDSNRDIIEELRKTAAKTQQQANTEGNNPLVLPEEVGADEMSVFDRYISENESVLTRDELTDAVNGNDIDTEASLRKLISLNYLEKEGSYYRLTEIGALLASDYRKTTEQKKSMG